MSKVGPSTQEGVVQATNPPLDVVVADDRLVSHAGVALLAELADRLGLSSSLDRFVGGRGRTRRHPLARVLRDLIVMLADGGDCLSDLRLLGGCSALLGPVTSIPTAWRVLERLGQLGEDGMAALRAARAQMRARAWRAGARPPRRLILDLDATLLRVVLHRDDLCEVRPVQLARWPAACFQCVAAHGFPRYAHSASKSVS